METFFDCSGQLRSNRGGINSPFGNLDSQPGAEPRQNILDNALSYAAMGSQEEAATMLIERGADPDSHPLGFHYRGTALHWAAIRGHWSMCDLLLARGASPSIEDLTVQATPAGWATHGGHDDLAAYLVERCRLEAK